jgi:aspartyl aminopeptidase
MQSRITHALLKDGREYSERVLKGLRAGISHFHAVDFIKNELLTNGFTEVKEQNKWALKAGGSYFFTRN